MARSTNDPDPRLAADLLGYHLGIADQETCARVEAAFDDPSDLATARRTLQKLLAPLDADEVPQAPSDLVAGVLDRVSDSPRSAPQTRGHPSAEEAGSILEMPQPALPRSAPKLPAAGDRGTGGGPPMSIRDLMSLAAAILIFVGIFVPGFHTARTAAQRTMCADNLRQIGNGYVTYAETYGQHWPYAGAVPAGASWIRTSRPGVLRMSNSRHVFKLVRGRFTVARAFICPSRQGDVPLNADSFEQFDDFPDPRNNSYPTNFVTRAWRQGEFAARMPIAADPTPLVDQQRRLIPLGRASKNSDSHGRSRGQNVLRASVSVKFFRTPNVGIEDDDIYRLIGVRRYTGLERPRARSDAFLIP
jgi:hypothetical protein